MEDQELGFEVEAESVADTPSASAKQRRAYRSQSKRLMQDLRAEVARDNPGTETVVDEDAMRRYLSRLISEAESGKRRVAPAHLSQWLNILASLNGWSKSAKGSKRDREERAEKKLPIPDEWKEILTKYNCSLTDLRVNLEPNANRAPIPAWVVEEYCKEFAQRRNSSATAERKQ